MEQRVATSQQLRHMILFARANELNRSPTDWVLDNLDPNGLHVVTMLMMHEHAAGQKVPVHARCQILAKITGREDPCHFVLDTDICMVDELPEARAVASVMKIVTDLT